MSKEVSQYAFEESVLILFSCVCKISKNYKKNLDINKQQTSMTRANFYDGLLRLKRKTLPAVKFRRYKHRGCYELKPKSAHGMQDYFLPSQISADQFSK